MSKNDVPIISYLVQKMALYFCSPPREVEEAMQRIYTERTLAIIDEVKENRPRITYIESTETTPSDQIVGRIDGAQSR